MKGEKNLKNIKTKILIIVIVCMMVIAITPAFLFGELKADSLTMNFAAAKASSCPALYISS